ncbi:hypothetical protein F4810DRAFT_350767 [Camillea tinctor]|nr:hypothetical protein F4810DRAFT_350767 [Camillea tinctor]
MKTSMFQVVAAVLATAVSSVYAQTTTAATTCAAQNILETCLATTEGYVSQCTSTDYSCMCDKYTAIMTCFNNCPNDSRSSSYNNQKVLYCMNASLYASTAAAATPTSSGTGTTAVAAATTTTGETGSGSSRTTAGATSSSTGAAATQHLVGGFAAAVAGVAAVLL